MAAGGLRGERGFLGFFALAALASGERVFSVDLRLVSAFDLSFDFEPAAARFGARFGARLGAGRFFGAERVAMRKLLADLSAAFDDELLGGQLFQPHGAESVQA